MSQHLIHATALLLLSYIPSTLGAINTTIVVSSNYSNRGDPNLLCRATKWTDIVAFFLGNYVAHAATVMTLPGESGLSIAIATAEALLFPITGMLRGVRAIQHFPIFGRNQLEIAARAGALCMVVEESDREEMGDGDIFDTQTHGQYDLPSGYYLRSVPRDAKFKDKSRNSPWNWLFNMFRKVGHDDTTDPELAQKSITICCNYNIAKIFVALGQTIFATTTLYRTRGDQIDRYGYASFGLTVTPYLYMSFINLLANLACPTYPTRYLVRSKDMVGLEEKIDGVVGEIEDGGQPKPTTSDSPMRKRLKLLRQIATVWACAAVPVAIVGGLSSFDKGQSTRAQRVWTMAWLAVGLSLAGVTDYISKFILYMRSRRLWRDNILAGEKTGITVLNMRCRTAIQRLPLLLARHDQIPSSHNEIAMIGEQMQRIVDMIKTTDELSFAAIERMGDDMPVLQLGNPPHEDNLVPPEHLSPAGERIREALLRASQKCDEICRDSRDKASDFNKYWWVGLAMYACLGAPAIGGMVVVGQMLVEYGTCIRIT